ncbi:MAG TPA: hypothetical protein VFJ14_06420 [Nocardioidaceae bacterium]|nr:hypothetical protein [Nocardioidaceae bacterium]
MTGVPLPDWLVAELPDVKPHGRVDTAGPSAVLYVAPDASTSIYPDIVSAYEALRDVDLEFSPELVRREGARAGMITFPSEREGSLTAWMPRNDARDRARLEDEYGESLAWATRYRREGGANFLSAFRYIDTHPAFWIRRSGAASERSRWVWETSGHMNRVDLGEHFHDPYLDAAGRTFEEAVLMLARNVSLSFNDDGTGTGAKPPNAWADEWIGTIKARIDDLEVRGNSR